MKTCEHCGKEFEEHDARQKYCSSKCSQAAWRRRNRDYYREYYRLNREKILEKSRERYRLNRERLREYWRKYYLKNHERILFMQKKYRWEKWK